MFRLHEPVIVDIGGKPHRGTIEIDAGGGDFVVRLENGERVAANARDIRSRDTTQAPPIPGMRTA